MSDPIEPGLPADKVEAEIPGKKLRKKQVMLSDAERFEVLRMMGSYARNAEIEHYLISIGKEATQVPRVLHYYRHNEKFRPLIEKFRAQFEAKMTDIAITSKRYRLQNFQILFDKAEREGKIELAAKMLDRAREECEGKSADGRPNIFITQFNQLSDSELEERKLKIISAMEKIKKRQLQQFNAAEIIDAEVIEEDSEQSS